MRYCHNVRNEGPGWRDSHKCSSKVIVISEVIVTSKGIVTSEGLSQVRG